MKHGVTRHWGMGFGLPCGCVHVPRFGASSSCNAVYPRSLQVAVIVEDSADLATSCFWEGKTVRMITLWVVGLAPGIFPVVSSRGCLVAPVVAFRRVGTRRGGGERRQTRASWESPPVWDRRKPFFDMDEGKHLAALVATSGSLTLCDL